MLCIITRKNIRVLRKRETYGGKAESTIWRIIASLARFADTMEGVPDLSSMLDERMALHNGVARGPDPESSGSKEGNAATISAELPPSKQKTADELLAEMKKIPLFMTSLDDLDEDNEQLQALRALAYEGTRAEIAGNFREQGNDCVKQKQYADAREFYTKALQALKGPAQPQPPDEGPSDVQVIEVDEEAEEKKERVIEEACYANRALCNLEMSITSLCKDATRRD